jgi:hypothetical protein
MSATGSDLQRVHYVNANWTAGDENETLIAANLVGQWIQETPTTPPNGFPDLDSK